MKNRVLITTASGDATLYLVESTIKKTKWTKQRANAYQWNKVQARHVASYLLEQFEVKTKIVNA